MRPSSGSQSACVTRRVSNRPPVRSATCAALHSSARSPSASRARASRASRRAAAGVSARLSAPVSEAASSTPGCAASATSASSSRVVAGHMAASGPSGGRSASPMLMPALRMPALRPVAPAPIAGAASSVSTLAPAWLAALAALSPAMPAPTTTTSTAATPICAMSGSASASATAGASAAPHGACGCAAGHGLAPSACGAAWMALAALVGVDVWGAVMGTLTCLSRRADTVGYTGHLGDVSHRTGLSCRLYHAARMNSGLRHSPRCIEAVGGAGAQLRLAFCQLAGYTDRQTTLPISGRSL